MWYAVQVRTGREESIRALCRTMISGDILKESFLPRCEQMRRYHGNWHREQRIMFPGYVFMISENAGQLYEALKKIPDLTKMFRDEDWMVPLYEQEVAFLLRFGGQEKLIKMSQGYIEGDRVVIVEGPMKDFHGKIKRIDRHKRIAFIEIGLFGRKVDAKVGLEIVRKE